MNNMITICGIMYYVVGRVTIKILSNVVWKNVGHLFDDNIGQDTCRTLCTGVKIVVMIIIHGTP